MVTRQSERRAWSLSAALFVPLLVLLVVAGMTWRAERQYAAVTRRVVHDYTTIAAWQYARAADTALHTEAMNAFSPSPKGHQRVGHTARLVPAESLLVRYADSPSVFRDSARFAFSYDVVARRLETAGRPVDDSARAMIQRRLHRLTESSSTEPHWVVFDSSSGQSHAIAIWMPVAPDRPSVGAYGLAIDPRLLDARFRQIIRDADLVPGVTDAPLDENGVALRLVRDDGGVVFATALEPGSTAGTDTAALQRGALRATVDFSPSVANALLGAPASQLPLLGLLIVFAAVLAGMGVIADRRNRELASLRNRFVANVSHELRTPLAHISMFAETLALRRERSESEGRQFAAIILAEARRLTALVESVLRFSRLEAGRDSLRLERSRVAEELQQSLEAFAPIAESAEATVTLDAGDADAEIDRAAFRQIVLNLLDNAVKHAGRGVAVEVSAARAGAEIRVAVDDSGPGVPPEWRERVFEPFVRIEGGSSSGAGIGLAVVRDLVAAHHGRVWVERSLRGGARFVVALPAVDASVEAPAPEPAPAAPA